MSQKKIIALALGVMAALAAGAYIYTRAPQVKAVTPHRGTAAEIIYATGAVEPVTWARVATLSRGRILYLCECEGQTIRAGHVLARLDDTEVRAQLRELKAREEFARGEVERMKALTGRGVTSTQSLERAQTELNQIQALAAAQTERVENFTLTSPMDGQVLRQDGHVGEIAESGQSLYRVGQPHPLQIVAQVNEEDIPKVRLDQRVLLRADAFANRTLEGKISEITPAGDPVAKTFRIKIALADDTPLRIGMSVEANIVAMEKSGALLVPSQSLRNGAVFVIEGARVRRQPVTIGATGAAQVEILEGLADTDRIASSAEGLENGQRVRSLP